MMIHMRVLLLVGVDDVVYDVVVAGIADIGDGVVVSVVVVYTPSLMLLQLLILLLLSLLLVLIVLLLVLQVIPVLLLLMGLFYSGCC